jgi:hypothetical protein
MIQIPFFWICIILKSRGMKKPTIFTLALAVGVFAFSATGVEVAIAFQD